MQEMSENKEIASKYAIISNCFDTNQKTAVVENRLEVLTALSQSLLQEIEALRQGEIKISAEKIDFAEEVQRFEENLIRSALIKTGGRQRRAAKILNLKASTLNSKIKRFGIL